MYFFKKSTPADLGEILTLLFNHPQSGFVVKNNLSIALRLFDIDINELNNQYFLYESPVVFTDQNTLSVHNNL